MNANIVNTTLAELALETAVISINAAVESMNVGPVGLAPVVDVDQGVARSLHLFARCPCRLQRFVDPLEAVPGPRGDIADGVPCSSNTAA